jgi:hypothetical protein
MSEIKLQEGIIYMIDSHDTSINGYYVGSTLQEFNQRRNEHKFNCTNSNSHSHYINLYFYIRQNGGWDNFKMTVIDRVLVEDKPELLMIEQDWQDVLQPNLNVIKSYESSEDRKVRIHNTKQIYYEKNKTKILEQRKNITTDQKNKRKIYRSEKIQCLNCDKKVTRYSMNSHIETKYCINYKSNQNV